MSGLSGLSGLDGVAIVGEWPDDSSQDFIQAMKKYAAYDFYVAKNTVRSGIVPDGFDRLREVRYAHEIVLAGRSRITVFGNNGVMGGIKGLHLERLIKESVLIVWTPPGVVEVLPEQDQMIPGVVQVAGPVDLLASICAYITLT